MTGKERGREFLLPEGQDIVLGRSDSGEFLVDDFRISKREAVITGAGGEFFVLKDVGAESGVVVNGQKVAQTQLKEGDRIRMSGVMLMMVAANRFSETFQTQVLKKTPDSDRAKTAATLPKAALSGAGTLAGQLKEVPVAEVLQFLCNSKKSGVLKLESGKHIGKIYLRDGLAYFASIDGGLHVHPQKQLFRLLRWNEGAFEFGPPETLEGVKEITDSTSGLLLDGVQQADEVSRLAESFPPGDSAVRLAKPNPGALRHCSPDELDVVQLVLEHGTVQGVMDYFPVNQPDAFVSDVEIMNCFLGLLRKGFIVTEPQKPA